MESPAWLEAIGDQSVRIRIRLQPRASKNELIRGDDGDGVLRARVTSPPIAGAANSALLKLIAKSCRVKRSQVTLLGGLHSRNKTLLIDGVDASSVLGHLRQAIAAPC